MGPAEFAIVCFLVVVAVVQVRLVMERAALRRRELMIEPTQRIVHSEEASPECRSIAALSMVEATRPTLPLLIAVLTIVRLIVPSIREKTRPNLETHELAQLAKLYDEHVLPVNLRVAWPWYAVVGLILIPILSVWAIAHVIRYHFHRPVRRILDKVRHAYEVAVYYDSNRRLHSNDGCPPTSSSGAA
jgi:hypothetical protein